MAEALRALGEIDRSNDQMFNPDKVKVELQFGDGSTYPHTGKIGRAHV